MSTVSRPMRRASERREKEIENRSELKKKILQQHLLNLKTNHVRYEPVRGRGKYKPHQGKKEMEKRRPKWRENADGMMVAK